MKSVLFHWCHFNTNYCIEYPCLTPSQCAADTFYTFHSERPFTVSLSPSDAVCSYSTKGKKQINKVNSSSRIRRGKPCSPFRKLSPLGAGILAD